MKNLEGNSTGNLAGNLVGNLAGNAVGNFAGNSVEILWEMLQEILWEMLWEILQEMLQEMLQEIAEKIINSLMKHSPPQFPTSASVDNVDVLLVVMVLSRFPVEKYKIIVVQYEICKNKISDCVKIQGMCHQESKTRKLISYLWHKFKM